MEVTYKGHYKIRTWQDDGGVLNFEAQSPRGNVLAGGFDMCGVVSMDEAIRRMQQAVDSSREDREVTVPLSRKIDRVRKSR